MFIFSTVLNKPVFTSRGAMLILIIVLFLIGYVVRNLNKPRKPPILGIYTQKNPFYRLKYVLMYSMLKLKLFRSQLKRKKSEVKDHGLEGPKQLYEHPLAVDAVYFNGTSKDGAALICGVARRPNNICNAFLYLRVEGGDMMLTPCLPCTTLQQTNEEKNNYHVSGIKIDMVSPMKTWSVRYNGKMKLLSESSKTVDVQLDAEWERKYDHHNYDDGMSPSATAAAIAREMWSEQYFKTLEKVHQTHYEQYGKLKGRVLIDGKEYEISTDAVRDHSYGKYRDWKNFHRYGIHFITLANGDNITVGNICMPICFTNLNMGFICKNDTKEIHPVDYCNLELYQHGENSRPPLDYAFRFKAGGITYTVQVNVVETLTFYLGQENECRIAERLAKFTVNGIEGWGAAEWQYRNIENVAS